MTTAVRWLLPVLLLACIKDAGRADDWPQWMGPERDDVWAEKGILGKFPKADKPEVKEVWRDKVSSQSVTPFLEGNMIYGVEHTGHLRGIKLDSGERVWETSEPVSGKKALPSGTAFLVKNGDHFFIFNEEGELVVAKLTPKGYEEIDRCKLLEPTNSVNGRDVLWSHPAFAYKCIFARNDKEIICASLVAE
jgi:outer membrane protein assembly factor BamB